MTDLQVGNDASPELPSRWVPPARRRRTGQTDFASVAPDATATGGFADEASLFRALLSAQSDCVQVIDLEGCVLWMNAIGWKLHAEVAGAGLGAPVSRYWPGASDARFAKALTVARAGGTGQIAGYGRRAGTADQWWDLTFTQLEVVDGLAGRLIVVAHDVTAHHATVAKLQWEARHDNVTGFAGHADFRTQLLSTLANVTVETPSVAVMMIEIDQFKQLRNAIGQLGGAELLKAFAVGLTSNLRYGDAAFRLADGEFALVLHGLPTGTSLAQTGQLIVDRLAATFECEGRQIDCSLSAGLAVHRVHGQTADELCENAEAALLAARNFGGNRLVVCDSALDAELRTRNAMLRLAEYAIAHDRIVPFYQPKIDLKTGAIVGFEALLRWRSVSDALECPGKIWAAFADPSLACRITDIIVGKVVADLQRWQALGICLPVAINISESDLRRPNFANDLLHRLAIAGIQTSSIEIEITESVFVGREVEQIAAMLRKLSEAGIRVALDDFGTGYASLSHLKQFPVDVIKVDRSFVGRMQVDAGDLAIVEAMLELAARLSIDVVAEGIERAEDAAFLRSRGCNFGQGYLFGRAVAAQHIPRMLRTVRSSRRLPAPPLAVAAMAI